MSDTTITVHEGEDKVIPIQINDGASPMVLTGATIYFMVKKHLADTDDTALIKKDNATGGEGGIDITDETGGVINLTLVPADTVGRGGQAYIYDVKVVTSEEKKYSTDYSDFCVLDVVRQS